MQEVYTAQYPDVIRLKAEIAGLERSPKATAAIGEEFRILDPAVPARSAAAPERRVFILLGLALSLGVAALAVHPRRSSRRIVPLRPRNSGVQQAATVLVTIPLIGGSGESRQTALADGGPRSRSASCSSCSRRIHIASGNDQLAFLFSRGGPERRVRSRASARNLARSRAVRPSPCEFARASRTWRGRRPRCCSGPARRRPCG